MSAPTIFAVTPRFRRDGIRVWDFTRKGRVIATHLDGVAAAKEAAEHAWAEYGDRDRWHLSAAHFVAAGGGAR